MLYDMVFEGGGAKGMVFVGALQELDARGHTPARLLGTSAGSIMATFLAAGFVVAKLRRVITKRFLKYLDEDATREPEQYLVLRNQVAFHGAATSWQFARN